MNAAFMLLERHDNGIHALSSAALSRNSVLLWLWCLKSGGSRDTLTMLYVQ